MPDREPSRRSSPPPRGRGGLLADLPPPETRRWVARRKAQVVAAVHAGVLSLEEACRRYTLSAVVFASWELAIDRHRPAALRVTRLQEFRQA